MVENGVGRICHSLICEIVREELFRNGLRKDIALFFFLEKTGPSIPSSDVCVLLEGDLLALDNFHKLISSVSSCSILEFHASSL